MPSWNCSKYCRVVLLFHTYFSNAMTSQNQSRTAPACMSPVLTWHGSSSASTLRRCTHPPSNPTFLQPSTATAHSFHPPQHRTLRLSDARRHAP
jgi:hypothetical protein